MNSSKGRLFILLDKRAFATAPRPRSIRLGALEAVLRARYIWSLFSQAILLYVKLQYYLLLIYGVSHLLADDFR